MATADSFPIGHPRHLPEAWPLMLSRDQVCAYVGCSAETLAKVCPIQPRDMGANIVRYFRPDLDAWAAGLPARLPGLRVERRGGEDASPPAADNDPEVDDAGDDRRSSAVERARARASGGKPCRKVA